LFFGVLISASPVGVGMTNGESSDAAAKPSASEPSPVWANFVVTLGLWGLLLAVLNMFSAATPAQHVSWGGLLTFEAINPAFGTAKVDFHYEPLGDTIFMAACLAMVGFGLKAINETRGVSEWATSLIVNDTWTALADPSVGGGQRTMAAWCLLLGFAFYFWFGINHSGWMDVGVYSVTIALVAAGFALNHASRVPPGDENLD
tara:strand:- start:5466 stop:6074 length:609 start_codon:yes stop_codon:yes gene_type:complete